MSCAPREMAVKNLAERYDEAQVAYGIIEGGRLLEIFATADGRTWTLLVTGSDAVSCAFAAGAGAAR